MQNPDSLFHRAQLQAERILTHPRVETAARVSRGLLNLASQVGQARGGPVAVASAIGCAFDVVTSALELSESKIARYVRLHGLERCTSALAPLFERSGFLDAGGLRVLVDDDRQRERLLGQVGPDGVFAFVQRHGERGERLGYAAYETPDSDLIKRFFRGVLWERAGVHGLEIVPKHGEFSSEAALAPIARVEGAYLGRRDVVAFADEVERYRRLGISRSVLLYGPPGTGKSTFVLSYAELTRSRLLMVGAGALGELLYGDAQSLVDALEPDVLLLDDLDKEEDTESMHALLPLLKRSRPRMLIVVTCNDPAALGESFLRPGRGGELIHFGPPSAAERRELLVHYLDQTSAQVRDLDVDELVAAMSPQLTHDWVRDIAEHAAVYSRQAELLAYVERANEKRALAAADGSSEDRGHGMRVTADRERQDRPNVNTQIGAT